MTSSTNLWHDARATERLGDPGSGLGVMFSPWVAGDPVATALRSYTCTPEHRTVRVGHMFLTTARLRVVRALGELRAKGCSVQVVVNAHPGRKPGAGILALREVGVNVTCTEGVHDKILIVDAVRVADGRPDRSVWMGSQSLGGNALRANDESMLRLRTFGATAAAARANATIWNAYDRHWSAIYADRASCG
ncbi:MAG: phospholipase D-like domain-containing protein [Marmoricola sp.]